MSDILTSLLVISVFKTVLNDKVISGFINFLHSLLSDNNDFENDLKLYSEFISSFYNSDNNQNLYEYLKNLIYIDDNIISRGCSNCIKENKQIIDTAKYELICLYNILSYDYQKIMGLFNKKYKQHNEIINHLPPFSSDGKKEFDIDDIIISYSKNGYGIFACYNAFKFTDAKKIVSVKYFATGTLLL